jgi:hypothetical protein
MYVPYAGDTKNILAGNAAIQAAIIAAVSQFVKNFKNKRLPAVTAGFRRLKLENA